MARSTSAEDLPKCLNFKHILSCIWSIFLENGRYCYLCCNIWRRASRDQRRKAQTHRYYPGGYGQENVIASRREGRWHMSSGGCDERHWYVCYCGGMYEFAIEISYDYHDAIRVNDVRHWWYCWSWSLLLMYILLSFFESILRLEIFRLGLNMWRRT
jgi:hypothetical protein